MPTRKDKTNVTPTYREQVFIPASGATLMKQKARPKVAGRPVSSGAIEIVSPEFDLLTGVRGLLNMSKPNKVYANIGNGSNTTMFDGATTTSEAVKQGIKEARDYVRHPVIVETVERNKELAERISGKPARNMGWFTDGNRVPANTRAEVLQHYIDRPVHIQTSNDLPKGFLGDYTSANTRIRVKSGLNPYDTKRVTFHEGLHHSGYGNFEGGLYDLKAEKLFGIDDYLLGHEAAVNTAELGRMMGLELGQKYPGFQTFKDMIAKYNVDGFDKKFIFDKAILNTPRDYKRFWDALTGKYFTTAGIAATGLNLTNTDKMKCGGRRKAQLGLDIREGGIAIPIAPNMYYMDGRSHDEGGIGIGPNNKNGLEVEGGEVVKVGKNDVKVFSSVPLLRGVSPAQLVMGGANPDTVFKAQEEFKDRNRINDDGTCYEVGGEKNISINNLPSSFRGRKIGNSYYQIGFPPSTNKIKSGVTGFKNYLKGLNDDLDEFGITFAQVSKKVMPKPLRDTYAKIVNAIYKTNKIDKINTAANQIGTVSLATDKKKFGGSMIYTINGNVKNELSLRPKAKYGLATKYLKKKNKTTQKPVETKQKEESKILDIRNTAGYKVKQVAENPWVKYPVEVASYLLTGATAKGMQTGAKIASKAVNKIDDILGKPRQEYLSRNISDKTINYTASSKNSVGSTYKATPKDLNRAKKEVQNRPTINDLAEARSTVGNVPQHTTISYNSSPQNPVSTINYFDVKNTRLPNIERFGRKQMDAKTSRELDKVYRKAVGNKEPKSGFGRIPQQTTIEYIPKGESVTAYDASAEFHKRISDMLYNDLVKKYGKKGVDKAMKAERISKYEYGGRIKAKNGKFLKYKNGIFTDPETGEEFEVDPEVFKMYGNTKESGVIPIGDYTKGTFNARPQYYAEKRLPIVGSQSIAEKAGLARSGWSYGENTTFDYVPNINISVPTNYAKAVGNNSKTSTSSTARGRGTKTSTSKAAAKTTTKGADVKYSTPLKEKKESLYITGIKNNSVTPLRAGMEKIKSPASTGGGTQSKDGRWIGQYKTTNVGDWIGLGSNLAGSVASYFMTKNTINKMPEPIKPVMAQAAKLKTRYNVEPQLTELREAEQMNRTAVRRNTQSSNTSLAREQRLMNEARGARNTLYGQKENIETQLINQDRLNRQSVMRDNIRAYNEYLNRVTATKMAQNEMRASNINNLISGLTGSVSNILGTIESRRATNNTLRAIAAANPNVDARLIGGFDYYIDPITKRKYNKNQQYVGTING